jgi:hypothetical protein
MYTRKSDLIHILAERKDDVCGGVRSGTRPTLSLAAAPGLIGNGLSFVRASQSLYDVLALAGTFIFPSAGTALTSQPV